MAVAAYTALLSLAEVLDRVQHPSMLRLHLDRKQIEALQDKVSFLRDFFELHHYSQRMSDEEIIVQGLVSQITDVASEAEQIVDSHVVHQIRKGFPDDSDAITLFGKNIERIMEIIDSIKGKLMSFKEIVRVEQRVHVPVVSLEPPPRSSGHNTMVGFDEQLDRMMDEMMGNRSDLQILPVVGMGGIGKTTLARSVFDHSYFVRHFDIRLWIIVSQEYSLHEILLSLLEEPSDVKNNENGDGLGELCVRLHKKLFDRRYLIVMDDVWSTKLWDDLRMSFPDNMNGSRIMVTTRLSNVADSFGSNNHFRMKFLDEDQSWNLLREKTFSREEGCPPELEKIGKTIAKSCNGLPLAIVVVAGLLSNSTTTKEYWETIAKNVNSFANLGDDEHCSKVLALSYNHLPIHLKPCFLYMGIFVRDITINVSYLINLWVAEGFIKPVKDKTLEEIAQGYLKDLVDRNLILIHERTRRGRMKICGIHDLLKELCHGEHRKEYFYYVPRAQEINIGCGKCFMCPTKTTRRIYLPPVAMTSQPKSLMGCSLCQMCRREVQCDGLIWVQATKSVEHILHPTKLRYLDIDGEFEFLDASMNLLWNLKTLIAPSYTSDLPEEIWNMPQLRHLFVRGAFLTDPRVDRIDDDSTVILENLQTIRHVHDFSLSEDAVQRIPNLKTLWMSYSHHLTEDWVHFSLHNLHRLDRLESLELDAKSLLTFRNIVTFPHSLKKLSLRRCNIPWEEMTIIGSLSNLEVLKLYRNAFKGDKWNPVEGEFLRLMLLVIHKSDLKCWEVEKLHFPNLEHLTLRQMKYLEEIPSEIGDIETLRTINVSDCLESVGSSAEEILERQHDYGNEDLQLYVNYRLVLPGNC